MQKKTQKAKKGRFEKADRSIAAKKTQKKKSGNKTLSVIAACLTIIVLAVCVFIGCVYFVNFNPNVTILENVSVAGVDVGGMTQTQAIEAVQNAIGSSYTETPMVVQVVDDKIEISPASCGGLDIRRAVWAACRFGQSGLKNKRESEQNIALTTGHTVDLTPYLDLDEDSIREALAKLGEKYSSTLSQSTYEVTGEIPNQTLLVHLGIPEYGLDLDKLYEQVMAAYSQHTFFVEGKCGMIEPTPVDLDAVLAEYYAAPVDAHFDPDTFEVIAGVDGYGFDVAAATEKVQQAKYGTTVEIPFTSIPHETTAEMLSEMLYRDQLATYTAYSSSAGGRDTNLRLACEAVNGIIVYPGEVFDYNTTLGERTTERGYKAATAYYAGESIQELGGGICQISSSLYYCAMVADLEILVRENHGFVSAYMPMGMDATVSWGGPDFRFRNTTDYPIRIEASANRGTTTVTLIGTDTKDYYVEMEYKLLSTTDYETKYEEMDADNPKGLKDGDYITTPYTGYTVETYRCKYNKETDELIEKKFEVKSKYNSRDAVICKIITETTVGATEPATQPSTEPPTEPGIGNGSVTEDGSLPPELP